MDKVLSGRHILVVEDEMMNLMMIEDMLADLAGASASAAATVDQALALIERQVFDAAMLDLNLNGIKSTQWLTHSPSAACRSFSRPAIAIMPWATATAASPCSKNPSNMKPWWTV